MLLTYMALNHLALGDYDDARVAIKQTHELEAVLAEQRAKQIAEVQEEAKKRGARTSFKELNGYPVQSIDNPEVNALKNSYQSALSHYLAGFIYEALGEPSLAAPGLSPRERAAARRPAPRGGARAGWSSGLHAPDDGKMDVLFIVASGTAPAIHSQQFRMPVLSGQMVFVPIAFPVIAPSAFGAAAERARGGRRRQLPLAPHHEHRPDGAPQAEGRHAVDHAARGGSRRPRAPSRKCRRRGTPTEATMPPALPRWS